MPAFKAIDRTDFPLSSIALMITFLIVGWAIGDFVTLPDFAGVVFAAFFAIAQTLEIFLESSPSARLKVIEEFCEPIDGSSLIIG
jgi:hypothetical protein